MRKEILKGEKICRYSSMVSQAKSALLVNV